MTAYLNRIATAVPPQDVHAAFVTFAQQLLGEREGQLFRRTASRSAIEHRYSTLRIQPSFPGDTPDTARVFAHEFYRLDRFPSTAERMRVFERMAPPLARAALDNLKLSHKERARVGHVIVTCCTGLSAPGLDVEVVDHLALDPHTDRTMIGFMGCYAAMNGLKLARHIVRSEPGKSVVMLNLELCTLHLQQTQDLGAVLAFLVFADGCAASLISAEPTGLALDSFDAIPLPNSRELITWKIGDNGFDMHLSGQVPLTIRQGLASMRSQFSSDPRHLWAVHPGGRTVLDAVEAGLVLAPDALTCSREVLADYGNMSSATVMFVLQKVMARAQSGQRGTAMSFGPGLVAETMHFHAA